MPPTKCLDAALWYARHGWYVHPLSPQDKRPLLAAWPKQATTDAETIRRWWNKWPEANVGVVCGASGLVVIDVDCKGGAQGLESWRNLREEVGAALEDTVCAHTPTGGLHYYYAATEVSIPPSVSKLGPGLDVRAANAYVVAPPSVTVKGVYSWAEGCGPHERKLAPVPPALTERLTRDPQPDQNEKPDRLATTNYSLAQAVEMAAKALRSLAPWRCDNYDSWISVGMALHAGLGALGLPLWEEWSQRSAKYAPGVCAEKWKTFSSDKHGLTLGSLFHWSLEDTTDGDNKQDRYTGGSGGEHCTDMGNAARLARRHGHNLRYCDKLGGWFVWDGRRWALDEAGAVERLAKETVRSIYQEAAAAPDKDSRQALARWAMVSESVTRLRAMIDLAKSEPGIAAPPEVWDTDPWLLNVTNGTLDLRTGELRPHRKEDMLTKLAPVEYAPTTTDPILERYLADTTGGDEDFAAFLQRAVGYSLTGCTDEETFFLVLGPAATGKSTLVEALLHMLGDYAHKASFDTFLEQRNVGAPRPDIASLRGVRLVVAVETARTHHLAEAVVKELSGGDSVTARFLYSQQFTFKPICKIWLAANEAPQITDTDTGTWRRLRRLPFEHVVPESDRDPAVKRHLGSPEGRKALLAWAVRGCLDWQRRGLGSSEVVRIRTAELRAEMNPIAEFLETRCMVERQAMVSAKALRAAYEEWASEMGAKPINNREWGKRLRGMGCQSLVKRLAGVQVAVWQGIGLVGGEPPSPGGRPGEEQIAAYRAILEGSDPLRIASGGG